MLNENRTSREYSTEDLEPYQIPPPRNRALSISLHSLDFDVKDSDESSTTVSSNDTSHSAGHQPYHGSKRKHPAAGGVNIESAKLEGNKKSRKNAIRKDVS
jgi:hypothetical protein